MRNSRRCLLPVVFFAAASAIGQQTWIVDASNGPGTNFTNLQPAIVAATAGDRILVRAGVYTPTIVNKPLTIVGSTGAVVAGSGGYVPGFLISYSPAGSITTISKLTLATTGLAPTSLGITGCAGTVILDHVHVTLDSAVSSSADVRCNHCTFDRPVSVFATTCTIDSSTLRAVPGPGPSPALVLDLASHGELNRCTVIGATSAIHLDGASSLVLRDDGTHRIATLANMPVVDGIGQVVLDRYVVLLAAGTGPRIATTVNALQVAMPSLAIDAGPPGGTVEVDLFGAPGDAFLEIIGVATPPGFDPVFQTWAWLAPTLLWSSGTFGSSGRVLTSIPLPNVAAITGITHSWQAAVAGPITGLALSNCVSYVHPAQ